MGALRLTRPFPQLEGYECSRDAAGMARTLDEMHFEEYLNEALYYREK